MATAVIQPATHPELSGDLVQVAVSGSKLDFQQVSYGPSVSLSVPYALDTVFPLGLAPTQVRRPISEKVAAIKKLCAEGVIGNLIKAHGAIYFSNLNLASAEEFSQFAAAFGWAPHEDIGNPVRRTIHAYNVATANEGPNTQPVYPHNEFGLSPHHPAYVFFYCSSPPSTGKIHTIRLHVRC